MEMGRLMAGAYVSLVMQAALGVDPSAKLVLAALADCANVKHNGVAFPSIGTLARITGLGETQARRHLQALVAAGWLSIEGASNGGRGMTTRYRLNLAKMRGESPKGHGLPQGLVDVKPIGAPQGNDAENGAADRGVSEDRKGAADRTKGSGGRAERVRPAAPDMELTGNNRGGTHPAMQLRDVLNRKGLKTPESQPEKPAGIRVVSARPAGMSQAEQIAYAQKHAKGNA